MKLSPLGSGAAVTAVILLLVLALDQYDRSRIEARQQVEAVQELRLLHARIEGMRDKYLYFGAGLAAYVATHPDVSPTDFAVLVQRFAQDDVLLRKVSLIRGGVIHPVYAAVARSPDDAIVWLSVRVPEGDRQVAGREIEIGLDRSALLMQAGLREAGERLHLALRKEDGQMLVGAEELFATARTALTIELPDERWSLAGRARPLPDTPWQLLLGMVCAVLGGLLVWMLRREQLDTRRLALHDCLTGLPNRRLLQDRVQRACAVAARSGRQIVLMYLDLDNFKPVNDNYGHHAGDIVLREVAQRLRGCVRRSDTVARVSGDEFVLVLEEMASAREAEMVAEKVLMSFARPIISGEHAFVLGCSIGLVSMEPGCDVDAALVRADHAMYQAKREGKNSYRWYAPEPEQLQLAVPVAVAVAGS